MPLGAGAAPAGSSAAGYGVPDSAAIPIAATLPDVFTGLAQTGRFLDAKTKSYRFTADGRLYGMATVNQLVQLALTTVRGSSALPSLGQTFTSIQEQGPDLTRQLGAAVSTALSALIRQGLVQLVSTTVQQAPSNPDAAALFIQWVDLTTGTFNTNIIGP